jgi:hypothetical protein
VPPASCAAFCPTRQRTSSSVPLPWCTSRSTDVVLKRGQFRIHAHMHTFERAGEENSRRRAGMGREVEAGRRGREGEESGEKASKGGAKAKGGARTHGHTADGGDVDVSRRWCTAAVFAGLLGTHTRVRTHTHAHTHKYKYTRTRTNARARMVTGTQDRHVAKLWLIYRDPPLSSLSPLLLLPFACVCGYARRETKKRGEGGSEMWRGREGKSE